MATVMTNKRMTERRADSNEISNCCILTDFSLSYKADEKSENLDA